ncbi:uncharacterized protein N7483_003106 [Penicillium malachiteum]|uniref:uncharacterized protein n=1 Tax=Penicillium malachiteum TaxID=1324776 RepID=UPI00254866AC|nr:uncharacterized protein N7483_003106 [Penicillium malachiteum]KAJ5728598.1 hypothetical protein N7483_003106 [Penicillium malachiteum]
MNESHTSVFICATGLPFNAAARGLCDNCSSLAHFDTAKKEYLLKCGVLSRQVLDYYRSAWAPMADISILNGFWNECKLSHPECQSEAQEYMSSLYRDPALRFRVIDVVTDRVILAPLNCRYVALSYVWGSGSSRSRGLHRADFVELSTDGALSSDTYVQLDCSSLEPTISDAMQFVKLMGLRYLWIDQLCIVQDDPEELLYTMKAMNKIYGASAFTIIASGKDATSGLPGVNKSSRQMNPLIGSVDNITLFHALPDPATEWRHPLDTSTWNTRGWTYQELYFSQRQFIFAADRIYYNCRKLMKMETSPGNVLPPIKHSSQSLRDSESDPFNQYVTQIREYSGRSLTYPDDILNAFSGVMSDMSERHGIKPYHGIPLSPGGRGLEWMSERRLQRRSTFPSWSWAGWIGPVYYSTNFQSTLDGDDFYYHIRPVDENWGAASSDGILEFQAPHNHINLQDLESCNDSNIVLTNGLLYALNMDGESEWTTGSQECLLVTTYPEARTGGLIIVRKSSGSIYYRIGCVQEE